MTASPATTRLLVISPREDDRSETRALVDIVRALRRRSDVTVELWWLRGERGAADRVVDELRTAGALAALDHVPVRPVASLVRGRMLRRWIRSASPDWIILDGGLGDRAVTHSPARRAIRMTTTPSPDVAEEAAPRTEADLWLLPPGTSAPAAATGATQLELSTDLAERGDAKPFRSSAARHTVRRRLGLPTDGRLVVGWSGDGRGAGDFTATITDLRTRLDGAVDGLWLGDEPLDTTALASGVHHRPTRPLDVRLCGDAVVLIGSAPVEVAEAHDALVAGLPVLSTAPPSTTFDRDVQVLGDGGADDPLGPALAIELANALVHVDDATTVRAGERAAERLDLRTWVAILMDAFHSTPTASAGSVG